MLSSCGRSPVFPKESNKTVGLRTEGDVIGEAGK